jgi:hypothetical protein
MERRLAILTWEVSVLTALQALVIWLLVRLAG